MGGLDRDLLDSWQVNYKNLDIGNLLLQLPYSSTVYYYLLGLISFIEHKLPQEFISTVTAIIASVKNPLSIKVTLLKSLTSSIISVLIAVVVNGLIILVGKVEQQFVISVIIRYRC